MSDAMSAHHLKPDVPSTLDQVNALLLAKWRERLANNFPAVDPLNRSDRFFVNGHMANRRMIARAWLSPAMVARRRRDRLRQVLRVITGGRT
jgi:hypothetical protein